MRISVTLIMLLALLMSCQQKKGLVQRPSEPAPAPGSVLCVPVPPDLNTAPGKDGKLTPLFAGLDVYDYPISTDSELAQKYFNQGFVLNYGFNHAEAARSFQEAVRQDPDCAMCYWGLAYVLGPNYNAGMEEDVLTPANAALAQAKLLMNKARPSEQALIAALSKRYPKEKGIDPAPYYQHYADEMKKVMKQFPDDLDIAVMTAEALMDLHPWDLYSKSGEPRAWTPEIVSILERVQEADPDHPQAMHLYIHVMEASNVPEKAIRAADNLRERVPGSGHLLHMPSHLYINVGQYHKGTMANERAVIVDSTYVEACHAAGIYPLAYYPHNWHFLAACAALEGKGDRAIEASRYMADYVVDKKMMYEPAMATLQHYYAIPWYIMVKFGKWQDILAEPKPDEKLRYPTAIWSYARGMALAARGETEQAEEMLAVIKGIGKEEAVQELTIWDINSIVELIHIAGYVLEGEIANRREAYDDAVVALKQAVALEDRLNYNEPPDWFFSVRHLLGDVLLKAGRYADAQKVFEKDLEEFKENGWALKGLFQSLEKQGEKQAAREVKRRYERAWQWADAPLESSVIM